MVHLFTLAIYVNDKTVVTGTKADKQNTHYADRLEQQPLSYS
jgi:agmatine/peptidylarginine deiminase